MRCHLLDGPAGGLVVERRSAPPVTWVAHGPLGVLVRYRRVGTRGDLVEYRHDGRTWDNVRRH